MFDFACAFSVQAIPSEMMNESIMYHLYVERNKIHAHENLRTRATRARLTKESVKDLIFATTGSIEKAEKAEAQWVLDSTRK